MTSHEDIESFIGRLGDGEVASEEVGSGFWVLSTGEDGPQIVVSYDPPVVVFRVNVMNVPGDEQRRCELMQRLLVLNAGDLVHGAYGIEGSHIVLTDALQLETLDFHEFQSSFDSITLALASHHPALAPFQE